MVTRELEQDSCWIACLCACITISNEDVMRPRCPFSQKEEQFINFDWIDREMVVLKCLLNAGFHLLRARRCMYTVNVAREHSCRWMCEPNVR